MPSFAVSLAPCLVSGSSPRGFLACSNPRMVVILVATCDIVYACNYFLLTLVARVIATWWIDMGTTHLSSVVTRWLLLLPSFRAANPWHHPPPGQDLPYGWTMEPPPLVQWDPLVWSRLYIVLACRHPPLFAAWWLLLMCRLGQRVAYMGRLEGRYMYSISWVNASEISMHASVGLTTWT